jgi:hypothetical protein
MRSALIWQFAAALVVVTLLSGGCARKLRVREPRGPLKIQALAPRVDVVLGHTAVIPVSVDGAIRGGRMLAARMDNGKKVEAELYWVSVLPDPGEPVAGWLPAAGRWSATPASGSSRPSADGFWVVAVDLPVTELGQGVFVAGERIALNWLPDPTLIKPDDAEGPWRLPYPEGADAAVLRMAEVESRSPTRRWRYRLLTDGLAPGAYGGGMTAGAGSTTFPDRVLEAYAAQTEAKWQVAMGLLWAADAELADRLRRQLVSVVDFGDGVRAPGWGGAEADLDALLNDVLNQRMTGGKRVERALAWMETQPAAAAWVVDDAGVIDAATGNAIVTCGVANLGDRATLAWAAAERAGTSPELSPLDPQSAVRLAVTAPALEAERGGANKKKVPALPVLVHAGRWSANLTAAAYPIPAAPPGVRIEPLLGDWTLAAWRQGTADAVMVGEAGWATAALLLKEETSEGPAWSVYLECKSPQEPAASGSDTVKIWLGPQEHPVSVIRVERGGAVVEEAGNAGASGDGLRSVKVSIVGDKWSAKVPIAIRCLELDGRCASALNEWMPEAGGAPGLGRCCRGSANRAGLRWKPRRGRRWVLRPLRPGVNEPLDREEREGGDDAPGPEFARALTTAGTLNGIAADAERFGDRERAFGGIEKIDGERIGRGGACRALDDTVDARALNQAEADSLRLTGFGARGGTLCDQVCGAVELDPRATGGERDFGGRASCEELAGAGGRAKGQEVDC